MPTDTEFSTLEAVVKVLSPCQALLMHFQEKSMLLHLQYDHCWITYTKDLLVSTNDSAVVKEMKTVISNDLRSRYTTMLNGLLDKCSYFDPRFRSVYLFNKEEVHFESKQEAVVIAEENIQPPSSLMVGEECDQSDDQPAKKKLKGLAAILKHNLSLPTVEEVTCEEKVQREMRRYEDYPPVTIEVDPLKWWQSEEKNYPTLAVLAKRYLRICATSVSSERLFSKAGYIFNAQRNKLTPDHVSTLLFLSKNID